MFEPIRFELVKREDKDKINKLTENTWEWGDYTPELFEKWVNEGLFIKAISNEEIVGIIHARIFDDFAWFEGVRVKQEIRRKGIGKALAKKAMEMSGKSVFRLAANEKNVPSIQLAKALGFKEIDRFYYVEGKDYNYEKIVEEFNLKETNYDLKYVKGFVNDWVWYPIEKYNGKIYANNDLILLETDPPFLVKGYIEGIRHMSRNFVSNSEGFIVFELNKQK
ncbi:sortase-like acyltransferase [Caldisphaera lagunensis DSM 15908]|uniref:Sortase-like acyltransferase n=1 Tax=Caldisphaera lagunensis (strain DSM 15908 / JCM 11604 / ANMR 0165 / IC-154) TaxID=1056495 RepID=L0ABJ9_CALLD|nr:GNAT family N-acetyltransferase [Caldisphaera lagunensis]AFZ70799.1 sortase-like acyltransferase [Caldisphaera lagunensis DSM 15908]